MAELIEFKAPEFLEELTEEHFTDTAMSMAPAKTDTSQGQMYYDHTKPTAIIGAEITQFHMPVIIQMLFPQFAEGIYLDWHGEPYNIIRHSAVKARGLVEVTSQKEGTTLPAGVLFYTLGDENEESKEYISLNSVVIESGKALIEVESTVAGITGNTSARTIVSAESGYNIDGVNNIEAVTGGTNKEDDESLRERVLARVALSPLSGARRDYERWAKEVDGVGGVIVQPLWNGPQTVRVLITDSNNEFANEELITRVKEYLDPKEHEGKGEGKAPIGAIVTVDTIEAVALEIKVEIYLSGGANESRTLERIKNSINRYLLDVSFIKIREVGSLIINTDGVSDYEGLTLNGDKENILLEEGQRAVVGEVINSAT